MALRCDCGGGCSPRLLNRYGMAAKRNSPAKDTPIAIGQSGSGVVPGGGKLGDCKFSADAEWDKERELEPDIVFCALPDCVPVKV